MSGERVRRPSRASRPLGWALLAATSAGLCFGAALAQDRGRDDPEVSVRRRARLTGPQQRQEARSMVRRGEQISRRIGGLLDDARRERDIIRITCLNDKLTQVNVNLRTAQARIRALEEAVEGNDEARRNHEFTILSVLDQKWRQLEREANECVGVGITDAEGRTTVRVWVAGVPDDDPTQITDVVFADVPTMPPASTAM